MSETTVMHVCPNCEETIQKMPLGSASPENDKYLPPLLSSLTLPDKTRLLVELDEWTMRVMEMRTGGTYTRWDRQGVSVHDGYHKFLTSYDAIIPLRIKVINTPELKVKWLNAARDIIARRIPKPSDFDIACITPDEDCNAVLIATGRARL